MNKFIVSIICVYLLISPFYIFESGLPQPADIIAAIGGFILIFSSKIKGILTNKIVKYAIRLLALITLINSSYWLYLDAFQGIDNIMAFVPIYYLFNFIFMLLFVCILQAKKRSRFVNAITITIIVSLSIQFILALLGVHGRNQDIESLGRPTLFFNNPNQLGYYSLSMITLFFILPNMYKRNLYILLYSIFISSYLIFYSGSRAALGGLVVLSIYMIYREVKKVNRNSIIIIGISFFVLPVLWNTDFVQSKIDLIERRNQRHEGSSINEYQIRGYDRILLNPEYIFFGAGEGKNDRFVSHHQLEIHSAFGTLLFSYGILGLLLFLQLLYIAGRKRPFLSTMLLFPILLYNFTHNGLRSSLLWAIIASLYLTTNE